MTGRARMRVGWVALGLAWLGGFAAMEGYALTHDDSITLSRFVVELSEWRPFIFLCGLTTGMLVSHFWWRWNPDDPKDHRG